MSASHDVKADRFYTKDHEWTELDGRSVRVGITAFAVEQLGDITLVAIDVKVGDVVKLGTVFGTIESVKTLSDLFAPLSGTVTAINSALEESPELVNEDPWQKGWMLKLEATNLDGEKAHLLDAAAYGKLLEETAQ